MDGMSHKSQYSQSSIHQSREPGSWSETNGEKTHDFYEDGWDEWSVLLRTKDRDVDIRLDLYTNLDQILSASNEHPVLDYYDDDGACY